MINPKLCRSTLRKLLPLTHRVSSSTFHSHHDRNPFLSPSFTLHNSYFSLIIIRGFHHSVYRPPKIPSTNHLPFSIRPAYSTTTNASTEDSQCQNPKESPQSDADDEVERYDLLEEELSRVFDQSSDTDDEVQWGEYDIYDKIINGYGGGGVDLQNCPWGGKVLSIAVDISLQLESDLYIDAFRTYPHGYIYIRLDRFHEEYGCPSIEDGEAFTYEYMKRLDKAGEIGEIPSDLTLEVKISERCRVRVYC